MEIRCILGHTHVVTFSYYASLVPRPRGLGTRLLLHLTASLRGFWEACYVHSIDYCVEINPILPDILSLTLCGIHGHTDRQSQTLFL